MKASRLAWLLFCLLSLTPAWAAVVPDASVVEPDNGAPRLPTAADPDVRHTPAAGVVPTHPSATPAATSVPSGSPTDPGQPQVAVPTSGGAFSDQNNTDPSSSGETRPLEPLAPAPVSTASTTPLWAALLLFLFMAIGGFWLAQRRDQD
ncbi:hypothetical protein JST97_31380 [bacterium]|nr:hypothetical protein [bacterium]